MSPALEAAEHEGRLVDVSARGVRLHLDGAAGFALQDAVRVEIRLEPSASPTRRVQLAGYGTVVRATRGPEGRHEIAVRLDAPLAFLERFPAFRVF